MTTATTSAKIPTQLGRALRLALYLALTASAVVTMAAMPPIQRRVEAAQLHPFWLLAPALFFGLFLAIYIGDRVFLLRYRHYPAGRALFQIVFALLVMFLLLPSSWREYHNVLARKPPADSLIALMHHSDPRVRAVACELQAYRGDGPGIQAALERALDDKEPRVRDAARRSLARLQAHAAQARTSPQSPAPVQAPSGSAPGASPKEQP